MGYLHFIMDLSETLHGLCVLEFLDILNGLFAFDFGFVGDPI